jgi:zinc transport system substrate-binding protein
MGVRPSGSGSTRRSPSSRPAPSPTRSPAPGPSTRATWGARPLLFSHPVYPYFERRYGLDARSLTWEPDELPSERDWRALESLLAEHAAPFLLWEAEPDAATARRLEGLGVGSVVFDPCATTPATGDFLSVMWENVARLEAALGAG